ncbi:Protein C2-DOMAIN ABA-RELATED 11 [Camellia lanceoleosa]|uniref:Protein C2-DOMAIN ABA-RELATED 11 n=1 Tax=Camellia lanceoleosa TaxID=1840588 RepID=A0ACC0GN73_9ERIC|nr:Protein C2-DOMAIN ABA-RELATED 11 [Camellia lanceoleosa]
MQKNAPCDIENSEQEEPNSEEKTIKPLVGTGGSNEDGSPDVEEKQPDDVLRKELERKQIKQTSQSRQILKRLKLMIMRVIRSIKTEMTKDSLWKHRGENQSKENRLAAMGPLYNSGNNSQSCTAMVDLKGLCQVVVEFMMVKTSANRLSKGGTGNYSNKWIMGEPNGQLKVTVVRGKKLVVRDFKSSDPYVIVKLGNQTAKTRVINSCLNPVWNEELSFSLTEPVEILNLQVSDNDRFKADDKMGHARLDLHPLISAARLRQILGVSLGETTLRRVIPDTDNCLAVDSTINCINGEVVQDVWLRLSDVESGEIELMIKLTNPPLVTTSSVV